MTDYSLGFYYKIVNYSLGFLQIIDSQHITKYLSEVAASRTLFVVEMNPYFK